MRSTITKTTIDDGQGRIDRKESYQIYNETDCSIHSPKGEFKTQKFTLINRQNGNDENEQQNTKMLSRMNQFNVSTHHNMTNNTPPLPPKRKTG